MARAYDLIVIGTGTAAMVASHRIASAGRKVAVIDYRPFGGTRALRGCDPKKMLVTGAQVMDDIRRMAGRGIVGQNARIAWRELIAFKRTFTGPIRQNRNRVIGKRGSTPFTPRHGSRHPTRSKLTVEIDWKPSTS